MSDWIHPNAASLHEVVSASRGRLILCSPYVSVPALDVVANALPKRVDSVEVWTKLDTRDWLTGASDPEGLLNFTQLVQDRVGPVAIRQSKDLHAKLIVSDGAKAMAGSANLTRGGFMHNIEIMRVVTGREVAHLHGFVNQMRPKLRPVTAQQFMDFVSVCAAKTTSKEALLELIRQEVPESELGPIPLMPLSRFLSYVRTRRSQLAREVLHIAANADGNNNQGKIKQAFFGVQRFLQEYPQHRAAVEILPMRWFDVAQSPLYSDWVAFLDRFADEADDYHEYSIFTLRRYLPIGYGGTLVGGGGGSNELKRIWPFVGRALSAFESSR